MTKHVTWAENNEIHFVERISREFVKDLFYQKKDFDDLEAEMIREELLHMDSVRMQEITSVINRWQSCDHHGQIKTGGKSKRGPQQPRRKPSRDKNTSPIAPRRKPSLEELPPNCLPKDKPTRAGHRREQSIEIPMSLLDQGKFVLGKELSSGSVASTTINEESKADFSEANQEKQASIEVPLSILQPCFPKRRDSVEGAEKKFLSNLAALME